MTETIRIDAPEPVNAPESNSLVSGLEAAARTLTDHADDIGTAARRVCAELKDLTGSATVSRALFHIAVAEGSSLRSRFVADHLSTHGDRRLARFVSEHALANGAKRWQKLRLEPLLEEAPSSDFGEGVRTRFDLTVTTDGVVTIRDPDPSSPVEADAHWFNTLISHLDDAPVGIHHDVVRIRCASTATAHASLRSVLERLAVLPVVAAVIAESIDAASAISELVGATLLDRARTVLLTPNRSGQYAIVSVRGVELLDAGPTIGFVLPTDTAITALAAALGLVAIIDSPALNRHVRIVVDAFRVESSRLLPLSSTGRFFTSLLRFRGTRGQTAEVRNLLTGHLLAAGFYDEALGLVEIARPSEREKVFRARRVRALYGTGRFDEIAAVSDSATASTSDKPLIREATAASAMLAELAEVAENTRIPFSPVPEKVLTILHASVPEQSGGYAVRAHSVLKTIAACGYTVTALTRPGFPESTNVLEPGSVTEAAHDGIRYLRMGSDSSRADGEFAYMHESVDHFAEVIRRERPSAVHLRSTYVSALPGLIAAKRFGLPVVYEVSGMWELVYEAANTDRMEGRRARTVALENAVLEHSDAVVTITDAMRDLIDTRVRTRSPIAIMPNAVDTSAFAARPKDLGVLSQFGWGADDPVIGYIGSFVGYEGLDVLVRAIDLVRRRGLPMRALLVGDGAESTRVRALAADLGLDESTLVFTGRVSHEQVADLYSVIDVCAYPRLLTPATRAVSPLKPFEAMAAKKSVIVSDVPALAEIVGYGERGLVVPSGDPEALAEAITAAIVNPTATQHRVEAAAAWTESERSWEAVGTVMDSVLARLTS
ncbi:glycosyltransferase family 4 protein [Brevibacterium oceani]|uniref:glycosyltransferase family 4 protein n=1 Tax=Brevibacterium oceani TaxID=358099 RepID=UPI001B3346A3|nr:glycosyltransferase family 4 protein [Brevibacterium oceani]